MGALLSLFLANSMLQKGVNLTPKRELEKGG
jgi:hypothetical protein